MPEENENLSEEEKLALLEEEEQKKKEEEEALLEEEEKKKAEEEEAEEKKRNYHRMERRYGSFSRSVALPPAADPEKVSASYKDGVLKITLGKKEEAKAKSIKIEVK